MAGDTTNDCTAVMRPGQDPAASAGVTVSPRLLGNVPHEVFSGMWAVDVFAASHYNAPMARRRDCLGREAALDGKGLTWFGRGGEFH